MCVNTHWKRKGGLNGNHLQNPSLYPPSRYSFIRRANRGIRTHGSGGVVERSVPCFILYSNVYSIEKQKHSLERRSKPGHKIKLYNYDIHEFSVM